MQRLLALMKNTAFTLQLTAFDPDAINGVGTLTYSEITLPNWLSLSSDGLLKERQQTIMSVIIVVVRVKDEAGASAEKALL